VTIEGTIFAPVPIGGGRLRQHAVGYFTRQVDGWRMHHDSLSIMPQHQGKGIGSAFIAESMRRAADEGVTLVSTSALSTKTSNGVYTWLRAGFDTPTGMVTARTTRNKLGARYRTAGDDTLATRLRGRNPVSTADLLASPVAKQALGGMPEGGNAVQMELQMNISDLRTEAALAASVFTDWVDRAAAFELSEDETWYEPIHELTARPGRPTMPSDRANAALTSSADPFAGLEVYGFACHDASCAPPPVGTGGSKPGADDGIPGIADQEAYDQYRETTANVQQLLDEESASYAQQQIQDAEVIVRVSADRLSDILNYSEPEDWELRSLHDPDNEVGRSLRGEEYLQHRDLYDAAVGLDMGYVVHGYSEAEFSVEPIGASEISHRVSPQAATWYGEIQLVMSDEAREDATFTITDSLNSGSVPLPIVGPIDPRAAALNGVHPFSLGRDYAEVQLRAPIEISSKHVKEIRVPDIYYLQDVVHVLAERMPDTMVVIEDDGIMMTMKNAVTAVEETS